MKKNLSILLVFLLILGSFSGCATDEIQTGTEEKNTPELTGQNLTEKEGSLIPEYYHYDPEPFYADCERLCQLNEKDQEEEMLALYDMLYEEVEVITDLETIAYINHSRDISDKSLEEEYNYTNDMAVECTDCFFSAVHELTEGDGRDALKKHISESAFESFSEYEVMSQEEKDLISQEQSLVNEYYKICDENGGMFTEEDYKMAGEIFVQLVSIRDSIAKLNGYDNYNDYADEMIYGRDYDATQLESFYSAVKEYGTDYLLEEYLVYCLATEEGYSREDILESLSELGTVSSLAGEASDLFLTKELYDIGSESNRADIGFTTSFFTTGVPVIFYKTTGSATDLMDMIHEMGHFTEAYVHGEDMFNVGCYDVFEIHSTALTTLATPLVSEVMDKKTATALISSNLYNMISSVVMGCIMDEFQRIVYENPTMTLEEICECFLEVTGQYGGLSYEDEEYYWMYISHNFEAPLYYISYATSAFVALQIWDKSITDYEEAVQCWEQIVYGSEREKGYLEVVQEAGLEDFTNTELVTHLLNKAHSYAYEIVGEERLTEAYIQMYGEYYLEEYAEDYSDYSMYAA